MKVYNPAVATTVKISEDTNAKLDRLQAKVLLRTGRRLSKQEILERLIRMGLADDALVVRPDARIRYPVPDRAWKKLLRRVVRDWGVVTREEDVDRILYGGPD
jgi:hypothetical protein